MLYVFIMSYIVIPTSRFNRDYNMFYLVKSLYVVYKMNCSAYLHLAGLLSFGISWTTWASKANFTIVQRHQGKESLQEALYVSTGSIHWAVSTQILCVDQSNPM